MLTTRYCINCESQLGEACTTNTADADRPDFCSDECSNEFRLGCDPVLLANAQEQNPDIPLDSNVGVIGRFTNSRPITGILPSTLDAVQSLLQYGGVSKEAIDKVINSDEANSQKMAAITESVVNDNLQNDQARR